MFPLEVQVFLRALYGFLFFCQLLMILPFGRVYFTSEKYGGCFESNPLNDRLFTPLFYKILMPVWMGIAILIACGVLTPVFCTVHLFLCYVFFVRMRWASITRGMGAPGLMPTWIAHLLFWLELSTYFGDPEGNFRNWVVFAFRFDFAVMMIDSGINKFFHGYTQNVGMNYGMTNPAWGYWYRTFQRFPKDFWLYTFFNHSAYAFQIIGGVLMLVPGAEWAGAIIIGAGFFVGVKPLIRLGVLCDMLAIITFLYAKEGGWFQQMLFHFNLHVTEPLGRYALPAPLLTFLTLFFIFYVVLIPIAKFCMYYNFYGKRRLPFPFQHILEFFTNSFGIILWRVFTVETVDFYTVVLFEEKATGKRIPYTRFGPWHWNKVNRFLWVGESVMMDIVFNTERFFPTTDLLQKRVVRYAKSMEPPSGHRVIFEYYSMVADCKGYRGALAKEFVVDVDENTMTQNIIDPSVQAPPVWTCSPVRASQKPGTYAPVSSK